MVSDSSRTTTLLYISPAPGVGLSGSATDETSEELDVREAIGADEIEFVRLENNPVNLRDSGSAVGPVGVASDADGLEEEATLVSTFQSLLNPQEAAGCFVDVNDSELARLAAGGFTPTLFSSMNSRRAFTHISEASLAS